MKQHFLPEVLGREAQETLLLGISKYRTSGPCRVKAIDLTGSERVKRLRRSKKSWGTVRGIGMGESQDSLENRQTRPSFDPPSVQSYFVKSKQYLGPHTPHFETR